MISYSAIFTQDEESKYSSGIYNYNDTNYDNLVNTKKIDDTCKYPSKLIIYEGSKKGIGDQHIKEGALFLKKRKTLLHILGKLVKKIKTN